MPASNFPEYAQFISDAVNSVVASGQATLVNLEIDQRSTVRGLLKGMLQFDDDSELHFREFVDLTQPEPRLMYAYHYQGANKALVFRYDNAAHRPPLSQAEHKHTSTDVIASLPPTLAQVVDEILNG